jgi:hypothetical protein
VVGELAGGRHPRQDLQEDGNMAEIKLFLNIFEQLGRFFTKKFRTTDKLKLMEQNPELNFQPVHACVFQTTNSRQLKQPNFKFKSRPSQCLGYLPSASRS